MKKIISVLLCCSLLLSGCSKKEPPKNPSPERPADISGEKVVMYHGDEIFPISFTVDGEQKIKNGTYWYYELEPLIQKEWSDSFYTYDEKLELNGSSSFDQFGKRCRYATNGEWALFLTPVHKEYDKENQNKVDDLLLEAVNQQLLANKLDNAAVMVTDIWECDYDGDGKQEWVFKATDGATYSFIGYMKENICQVFDGIFLSKKADELPGYTPVVCDLDGDGKWSVMVHKEGEYQALILFDCDGGNFIKCYDIIF